VYSDVIVKRNYAFALHSGRGLEMLSSYEAPN